MRQVDAILSFSKRAGECLVGDVTGRNRSSEFVQLRKKRALSNESPSLEGC
jgi:hypothetical protein